MPAAKVKKPKPKSKKELQAELEAHYAQLKNDVEVLSKDLEEQKLRSSTLSKQVFQSIPIELLSKNFNIHKAYDHNKITSDTLVDMVNYLSERRKMEDVNIGNRLTQLEYQVSSMTHQLNRSQMKMLTYENCLEGLHDLDNVEEIRDRIYEIQFLANCNEKNIDVYDEDNSHEFHGDQVAQVLDVYQMEPRLPGDTCVEDMLPHLKSYVIAELSHRLESRCDWRTLGQRVGVSSDLIDSWSTCFLAAGNVLREWSQISRHEGDQGSSSVRMLHRHLMSPPMRRTIVAKRIADIYDVE